MRSIRLRLTLVYTALLFLALALSGTAVITLLRHRLNARLDETLDRRLQGVENFLIRETTAATAAQIPAELAEYASTQPEGHLIEVRETGNGVLLKSDPTTYASRARTRQFTIYGKEYATHAAASTEPVDEAVEEMAILLLWSSPLLLLLIACSGYWLSSLSLRPVDAMTRAARRIGAEDLTARLPVPETGDEISRLAAAWNEMLQRLEESFNRIQRFTADAAHELRTPLASIRTAAELTLRRPRTTEEYRKALEQIVEVSHRMQSLTEALLAMARGQVPQAGPGKSTTDLGRLTGDLLEEMQPLFDDKELRVEQEIQRVVAEVDAEAIRRAVAILLDNAIKHTPGGGVISVSTGSDGEHALIRVADTGCGIGATELPRIFDRFYRIDSSRDRKTGGFGLGLSIAKQITDSHGGKIVASSEVGVGTSFTLLLPKM